MENEQLFNKYREVVMTAAESIKDTFNAINDIRPVAAHFNDENTNEIQDMAITDVEFLTALSTIEEFITAFTTEEE